MKKADVILIFDDWLQFSPGEPFSEEMTHPPLGWEPKGCYCVVRNGVRYVDWHLWDTTIEPTPCRSCVDGRKTIPLKEELPIVEHPVHGDKMPGYYIQNRFGRNWQNWPYLDVGDTLERVVAQLDQKWGPVPVVKYKKHSTVGKYLVVGVEKDSRKAFLCDNSILPVQQKEFTLPDDVDPLSFVGQWARGGTVLQ